MHGTPASRAWFANQCSRRTRPLSELMMLSKVEVRLGDARWLCCAGMLTNFRFVKMLAFLVCSRRHLATDCGQQTGTETGLAVSDVLHC